MKQSLRACAAVALLGTAPVASAGPTRIVHTPTPTPAVVSAGKEPKATETNLSSFVLPLKIDAVTLVSSWTPCAPLPGYTPEGSGNLLGRDANTVAFCGIASVRLKKTAATAGLAGKAITIQVSEQHLNLTPWSTIVGLYTLPFPASGDTLTFPRVAVGSFPGDNPAGAGAADSNRRREGEADYGFRLGRPVLVELRNAGQTIDKRNCTFKTTPTPGGTGPATLTCN